MGRGSAARRRRGELRAVSANARQNRLYRPAHNRARNPARAGAAESRNRPRSGVAGRAETAVVLDVDLNIVQKRRRNHFVGVSSIIFSVIMRDFRIAVARMAIETCPGLVISIVPSMSGRK